MRIRGLSDIDAAFKLEQEHVVQLGAKSWHAAKAIYAIYSYRDGVVYQDYSSFAGYCKSTWGYCKSHAYRLVTFGAFIDELSKTSKVQPPKNESQFRPLLKVPEAVRVSCWEVLISNRTSITSQEVETRLRKYAKAEGLPYNQKARDGAKAVKRACAPRVKLNGKAALDLSQLKDRYLEITGCAIIGACATLLVSTAVIELASKSDDEILELVNRHRTTPADIHEVRYSTPEGAALHRKQKRESAARHPETMQEYSQNNKHKFKIYRDAAKLKKAMIASRGPVVLELSNPLPEFGECTPSPVLAGK